MRNHDFKSLEGSVDDLDRLANFNGAIEGHDLFRTHFRLERCHNIFRQSCQPIAKMDNPSNSMRIFDGAMLRRIGEFCEQIAREHGLYEPNRASLGHFSLAICSQNSPI